MSKLKSSNIDTLVLTDVAVKCFLCGSRKPLTTCISTVKLITEYLVVCFESCQRCIDLLGIPIEEERKP